MFSIPQHVAARLSKGVTKYRRLLKRACDRQAGLADTVSMVRDMLSEIFGFDPDSEVSEELCKGGDRCDLAVLVADQIIYLLKVVPPGVALLDKYLKSGASFAAREKVRWIVLTNGLDWQVFKVVPKGPVSWDLVTRFDFLSLSTRRKEDKGKLFALCREAIGHDLMDLFHDKSRYINRFVIADILSSEAVVPVVWKVLRKIAPAADIDASEVEAIIKGEIINREILDHSRMSMATEKVRRALKR